MDSGGIATGTRRPLRFPTPCAPRAVTFFASPPLRPTPLQVQRKTPTVIHANFEVRCDPVYSRSQRPFLRRVLSALGRLAYGDNAMPMPVRDANAGHHVQCPSSCSQISRIRNFYMRKVKFSQATFHDKLTAILEEFPKLDVREVVGRAEGAEQKGGLRGRGEGEPLRSAGGRGWRPVGAPCDLSRRRHTRTLLPRCSARPPAPAGYPPVLRGPDQCTVRPRPLQACAGACGALLAVAGTQCCRRAE